MDKQGVDHPSSKRGWLRYVVISLLAFLLLAALKLGIEKTTWGHENELWVFGKLQGSLSTIDVDNPIVVLDIGGLPGGRLGEPTPREKLEEIITALTEVQPQPARAIAVDVNFSPKGPHYSSKTDEAFFDYCLSVRNEKRIPVFLAVAETKSGPPEAWLGNELYKDLAVAASGDKTNTSSIPLWVKSPLSNERLKTLNYALALEYRKRLPEAPSWISWAVDTNVEDEHERPHHEETVEDNVVLNYANRLVNYSKLDQMKLASQSDISAEAVRQAQAKYSDKLVILGDLSSDLVPVPGRVLNEPGSLVLASATYTLIKEPLFAFKWWVRLLLDFLIAGSIIVGVAVIRHQNPEDRSSIGKQALFVYFAVALVLVAGWKLASWAGVLWLDFLLVAFAALLHPKAEHVLGRLNFKLRRNVSAAPAAITEHGIDDKGEALIPDSPATPSNTGLPKAKTVAAFLLAVLTIQSESVAQESVKLPAGCDPKVAAVGLRLNTPKKKQRRKKNRTCYVRDNKLSIWQPLTFADAKRQFRAGQHVYCDENCSLTILYCGTQTEQLVNTRGPDWFPVIHAYRPAPLIDRNKDNFLRISQYSPPNPLPPQLSRYPSPSASSAAMVGAVISGIAGTKRGGAVGAVLGGALPPPSVSRARRASDGGSKDSGNVLLRTKPAAPARPVENEASAATESYFKELLDKGKTARQQGAFALALQYYFTAKVVKPSDYRGFQGLGNVFVDVEAWNAAEEEYRKALALDGLNSKLGISLAFVMLQSEISAGSNARVLEVEELLRWATILSPEDQTAYDLYERLFELQGAELSKMEPVFRQAVSTAPHSTKANLRLARFLYQSEQLSEAWKYVRRAEELAVSAELLQVAQVYESLKRYGDSERVLRRALTVTPDDLTILYSLGSVLVERKHFGEAIKLLQAAHKMKPEAFAPLLVLGTAELGKSDLAAAEISFDEAARKILKETDEAQRSAYWFSVLGDAYKSKGKFDEAIRAYEKSLVHGGENSDTRDKLEALRKRGSGPLGTQK